MKKFFALAKTIALFILKQILAPIIVTVLAAIILGYIGMGG